MADKPKRPSFTTKQHKQTIDIILSFNNSRNGDSQNHNTIVLFFIPVFLYVVQFFYIACARLALSTYVNTI